MATKRYITLQPDIQVMKLDGEEPYYVKKDGSKEGKLSTHVQFIKARTSDPTFSTKGYEGTLQAMAIWQAMAGKVPGDVIEIDNSDWELLCEATKHPKVMNPNTGQPIEAGYDGVAGPQLVPFAEAIVEAPKKDPRAKEEKAPPVPAVEFPPDP